MLKLPHEKENANMRELLSIDKSFSFLIIIFGWCGVGKGYYIMSDRILIKKRVEVFNTEVTKLYRTRVWFKIIHCPHPCKYAINDPQSWEASRNIATDLRKNDHKAHLLEISTLSTPEGNSAWLNSSRIYP